MIVAHVPLVDRRAFGPCGVGTGVEKVAHPFLGVAPRGDEEIDHAVLQQLVVARPEERRAANVLGRRAEDMLDASLCAQIVRVAFLAIGEVEHVLREVAELVAIRLGELIGEAGAHVAHRELAVVMVVEVTPVLLDVHLVGVERVELHAGVGVPVDEFREIGESFLAEVVHLGRRVLLDDDHAVESFWSACAGDPDARRFVVASVGVGVLIFLDLDAGGDLNDPRRIHDPVRRVADTLLAEREDPHARVGDGDRAFVVDPLLLPPELYAERARGGIAQALAVVHPDAALARGIGVGLADLERAEQAELQPQPVPLRELAM